MIDYIILTALLILSALFSGLTLGLMSLSVSELRRKMNLNDKDAKRVYAIREKGNLLLTTLLVGNVAVNAAISIFLGSITSGLVAGLVATGLIVVFGEILPQAIFSRYALKFGARLAFLVRIAIFILYPVAWPIAWALNKTLGEELSTVYSKRELMKIVEEHRESDHSDVDHDEERIIKGALTFSDKTVEQVMAHRSEIYAVNKNRIIDSKLVLELKDVNFSRIPVFDGSIDKVVGVLFAKDLIDPKVHNQRVEEVMRPGANFVDQKAWLDDVFAQMTKARHHLFIVKNKKGKVSGVITLEDVVEEIMKTEIIDEHDDHEDVIDSMIDRAFTDSESET